MEERARINDLYLAAYLATVSDLLIGTEREGTITMFLFRQCPELDTLLSEWATGNDDDVSASQYSDTIKRFKAIVMNAKGPRR